MTLTVEEELRRALAAYDVAAVKFCEKVETGKAHSSETYADMKACLRISRKAAQR